LFRNEGFANIDWQQVQESRIDGNAMLTSSLDGMVIVPEEENFFYNTFPGEGWLRAYPTVLFNLLIGPIPRALWTDKPIDPAWAWYSMMVGKHQDLMHGTTVSNGLVGFWYFRFGIGGVVEGGLLLGLLMAAAEHALRNANGRLMVILFSLGICTWLMRIYRDFIFIELYPVLIGVTAIAVLIKLLGRPTKDGVTGTLALE
jgi:hypothetical protein